MESLSVHDLTAAYALDALDADEAREYEEHLAHCERCRRELAELADATGSLAYAVDSPAPPPALRERILGSARAERTNVVPLRTRWTPAAKAITAVAACLAIGFGIWAAALARDLETTRDARDRANGALDVLSDPTARRVPLQGGRGALVVADDAAALVVRVLRAPSGKTYEAWVIQGGQPKPAGTFEGGGQTTVLRLNRSVPAGARVAVTVERDGGVSAPQGRMVLQSGPV